MKNAVSRLLAILGLGSPASTAGVALNAGECWSYLTRPGEEASFLVIRKIETLPKIGEVLHVSVFGLKIRSPSAPTGFTDRVGHLPISAASVRSSVKERLEREIPSVDWNEGYELWRRAETGGVFTVSVRDCVELVEQALNRGH
jgi:hypothetical protein